ncbi:HAD hydrolase-like protein [Escherichia coli]|nr:HAD hydrolase-like protein [Escherichia coli]
MVDEAFQQQALHDFYLIYKTLHKTMCPEPFEGIRELITLLKQNGIIVVLITGKGAKSCDITLRQFSMESCFAKAVTGNAERNIKSEALEELLHTYHLSADEIVYIGDTVSDIKECQKANVKCLSAAWSISQSETLESHNAKNVFYSISSMSGFLLSRIR